MGVGRVARGVQIRGIDLVAANFSRADSDALPMTTVPPLEPDLGMDVRYALSDDGTRLGCLLTFATIFSDAEPYRLTAQFRLLYDVALSERPSDEDLRQFANWNAVFNAWPYWREYLSSTLNRARLPYFLVPVMAVPLPKPMPTATATDETQPGGQEPEDDEAERQIPPN